MQALEKSTKEKRMEGDGRLEYEANSREPNDIELENIESEEQDYESGPADYQIATYPADFTLEVLHQKWKNNEIEIPKFQRKFVWKQIQASKLIESFLVSLPVPAIFLYTERSSQKYLVIDGQQRLKSVFYFFEGFFGEVQKGKRAVFKLLGLNERSKWKDKIFEDFDDADKRKLKNSVLRAFIVQQLDPEDDTSIYHIFERLNTGGTLLSNQEVRNCVYGGKFNDLITSLNDHPSWRKILGKSNHDSRQKDTELILRFFALQEIGNRYKKPLKDFLSKYMKHTNRSCSDQEINNKRQLFNNTCDRVHELLGEKPFHIRAGLNSAAFDSIMIAFAMNLANVPNDIVTRLVTLKNNPDYDRFTRGGTTDENAVRSRISLAQRILFDHPGQ